MRTIVWSAVTLRGATAVPRDLRWSSPRPTPELRFCTPWVDHGSWTALLDPYSWSWTPYPRAEHRRRNCTSW